MGVPLRIVLSLFDSWASLRLLDFFKGSLVLPMRCLWLDFRLPPFLSCMQILRSACCLPPLILNFELTASFYRQYWPVMNQNLNFKNLKCDATSSVVWNFSWIAVSDLALPRVNLIPNFYLGCFICLMGVEGVLLCLCYALGDVCCEFTIALLCCVVVGNV